MSHVTQCRSRLHFRQKKSLVQLMREAAQQQMGQWSECNRPLRQTISARTMVM